MIFSEKELENYLWSNLQSFKDVNQLCHNGLFIEGPYKFFRQVRLPNYGIIDILGVSIQEDEDDILIHLLVIELKANPLNIGAIEQIKRYEQGLDLLFWKSDFLRKKGKEVRVVPSLFLIGLEPINKFHLIARTIENLWNFKVTKKDKQFYFESIDSGNLYDKCLGMKGIEINEELYRSVIRHCEKLQQQQTEYLQQRKS